MSIQDTFTKYKIVQALRKVYFMLGERKKVMDRNVKRTRHILKDGSIGKRDRVLRQCELCKTWVMTKNFQVDHIEPIVRCDWEQKQLGTPEFTWDTYIHRMFCSTDNLQGICTDCHDAKTAKERALRKMWRDYRAGKCDKPSITYMGNDFNDYNITDTGWIVKNEDS